MKTSSQKKAKKLTLGVLLTLVFLLLTIFLFWRITDEYVLEKESGFDQSVFDLLKNYVSPAMTRLMLFFTFFGSVEFQLPAYLLLAAFFLYRKEKMYAYSLLFIGATGRIILYILKQVFHRARPLDPLVPDVLGFSYPSGHSFSAFTFFGALLVITWRTKLHMGWKWAITVLFTLLPWCTAISRVYLHAHFISDVVASFCLAVIWLSICFWIAHQVNVRKSGN